jgi:PmbA protein
MKEVTRSGISRLDKGDLIEKASQWKVGLEHCGIKNDIISVLYENDMFKRIRTETQKEGHVRVINSGRLGYYSYYGDMPILDHVIESAVYSSHYGQPCSFHFQGPSNKYQSPLIFDKKVAELEVEDLKHLCNAFTKYLKDKESNISCNVTFDVKINSTQIMNSEGLDIHYGKTRFYTAAWMKRNFNGRIASNYDSNQSTCLDNVNCLADSMLQEINWSANEVTLSSMKDSWNVILSPSVLSLLITNLVIAPTPYYGTQTPDNTAHTDYIRKTVDRRVTIYDDGISDWMIGSAPFDDEGTPTQITYILHNGVYKDSITDLQTSTAQNVKPTGNGRRMRGQIVPFNNNLIMKGASEKTFDEIVDDIHDGIYIGLATVSCNQGGDFFMIAKKAYKIENGKIIGLIKNGFYAVGNVNDLFNNIVIISKNIKLTKFDMHLPYIHFSNVKVVLG